jgi:hypothetical protein
MAGSTAAQFASKIENNQFSCSVVCSNTVHHLRDDIAQDIIGRERRSRENGQSFLTALIKEHSPPRRKSPRSKPPPRTAKSKNSKYGQAVNRVLNPKPKPESAKE